MSFLLIVKQVRHIQLNLVPHASFPSQHVINTIQPFRYNDLWQKWYFYILSDVVSLTAFNLIFTKMYLLSIAEG